MRLFEKVERLLESPDLSTLSGETQQRIAEVREALEELLPCPNCTYIGNDETEFDVLGAKRDHLICPCCSTEFEP